jgi:hypothetical protein
MGTFRFNTIKVLPGSIPQISEKVKKSKTEDALEASRRRESRIGLEKVCGYKSSKFN